MKKLYDDPIAHFKLVAKKMTDDMAPETVSISENEKWSDEFNDKCIGYFPFTKYLKRWASMTFSEKKT